MSARIRDASKKVARNVLTDTVGLNGTTLFEIGINRHAPEAWPIAVNVNTLDRHFYLTRTLARDLAAALLRAVEAVGSDVQCSRCSDVEDAKVHDRASRKWMHDYDEEYTS